MTDDNTQLKLILERRLQKLDLQRELIGELITELNGSAGNFTLEPAKMMPETLPKQVENVFFHRATDKPVGELINTPVQKYEKCEKKKQPRACMKGYHIGRSKVIYDFIKSNPNAKMSEINKVFGNKYRESEISSSINYIKVHKNDKNFMLRSNRLREPPTLGDFVKETPLKGSVHSKAFDKNGERIYPSNILVKALKDHAGKRYLRKEVWALVSGQMDKKQFKTALKYAEDCGYIKIDKSGGFAKHLYYYEAK